MFENSKKIILKDLASFLAKLAEKSDNVYWLSSSDFARIAYISPAYEKIWGRSRETLYAYPEKWITYLHPDDVDNYHPIHAMAERINQKGAEARYEEDYRIIRPDGEIRWIIDRGFPIYDDEGTCCGVTGVAIDVTNEKNADLLRLENQMQKTLLTQQQKFRDLADQVVHDIRSPLASLLMIVKSCSTLPERERLALREAAASISDIANNLLNQYKIKEKSDTSPIEECKPLLVSATLLEILTDKKYHYQGLPVAFDHAFEPLGYFAFIKTNLSTFKRMLSNLINNAVDAFDSSAGKVLIKLEADNESLKISIQDNGKGMRPEVVHKIMNKIAVTSGKKEGHGIGMIQIQEALEASQAQMDIHSVLGQGTKITLTFPRVAPPNWISEEIILAQDDIVIILDDDSSIHGAWDTHFESILQVEKNLQLHHFEIGQDALDFINTLTPAKKEKVFLLSDYELLRQDLTGLDVIAQSGVMRSLLVTSHYGNADIRHRAVQLGIKILPKQMASEIPLKIKKEPVPVLAEGKYKIVDLVIVEDSPSFAESIIAYLDELRSTKDRKYQIQHYAHPHFFLENLSQYAKDTKICLDNDLGVPTLNGIKLARQLHEQGYTKLYLLSGQEFEVGEIPEYLTFILKTDLEKIAQL